MTIKVRILLVILLLMGWFVLSAANQKETRTGQDWPDMASDSETFLNWLKLSSGIRIRLPSGNSVDYSGERLQRVLKQMNCYPKDQYEKVSKPSGKSN